MHEREGVMQGIPYAYRLIDLDTLGLTSDALPDLLLAAERMGLDGLNITYPCKQTVIPLLDELSEDARNLGAVNTVVLRDRRRIGHNTDWWGFAEAFKRELPSASLGKVVLLGAGGAGSAVAHALLTVGAQHLIIVEPDRAKAAELESSLERRFGQGRASTETADHALPGADGIVNATPIGMAKHPGMALDAALIRSAHWVADVIYFPLETELLRHARSIGCRTMGGGGMAVFQAVRAFELFSGRTADAARMQHHFRDLCAARQ